MPNVALIALFLCLDVLVFEITEHSFFWYYFGDSLFASDSSLTDVTVAWVWLC
jgi:hypothetical protein